MVCLFYWSKILYFLRAFAKLPLTRHRAWKSSSVFSPVGVSPFAFLIAATSLFSNPSLLGLTPPSSLFLVSPFLFAPLHALPSSPPFICHWCFWAKQRGDTLDLAMQGGEATPLGVFWYLRDWKKRKYKNSDWLWNSYTTFAAACCEATALLALDYIVGNVTRPRGNLPCRSASGPSSTPTVLKAI